MLMPSELSDEQKSRLRRLGWSALTKMVLSSAAAVGARLGERAVDWLLGRADDDDDSDDGEEKKK